MSPDHDPLDELRAAWDALPAPDPTRDADGEPEDELTRASVAWMRAAWESLEPARAPVPATLRRARLVPFPGRRERALLRAAAALLLATTAALLGARLLGFGSAAPGAPAPTGERSVAGLGEDVAPRPAPADAGPPRALATGPGAAEAPGAHEAASPGVRVASLSPEHLELRSGSVRLILLLPEAASRAEAR